MRLVLVTLLIIGALWLPGPVSAWTKMCPIYVRYSATVSVASGATGDAQVQCDEGDFATGGGDSTSQSAGTPPAMWVSDSFSIDTTGAETPDGANPTGWHVFVYNSTPDDLNLEATVVCACAASFVPVMNPCAPYVGPPYVDPPAPKMPALPSIPKL